MCASSFTLALLGAVPLRGHGEARQPVVAVVALAQVQRDAVHHELGGSTGNPDRIPRAVRLQLPGNHVVSVVIHRLSAPVSPTFAGVLVQLESVFLAELQLARQVLARRFRQVARHAHPLLQCAALGQRQPHVFVLRHVWRRGANRNATIARDVHGEEVALDALVIHGVWASFSTSERQPRLVAEVAAAGS